MFKHSEKNDSFCLFLNELFKEPQHDSVAFVFFFSSFLFLCAVIVLKNDFTLSVCLETLLGRFKMEGYFSFRRLSFSKQQHEQ